MSKNQIKIGIKIYDDMDDSEKNDTVTPDTIIFIANLDQLSALLNLFSDRTSVYDNFIMPM